MMERERKAMELDDIRFKRLIGVTKDVFKKMLQILTKEYDTIHKKGGRKPNVLLADKLLLTLQYWREYRDMEHIGLDYGITKGAVCKIVQWVENTLIKDGTFTVPGKKNLA
jgi:hypothetical protein